MYQHIPDSLPDVHGAVITGPHKRVLEMGGRVGKSTGGRTIVVLDRPYLVADKVDGKDAWYIEPAKVQDVVGWPLSTSTSMGPGVNPMPGRGELTGCTMTRPQGLDKAAYLTVAAESEGTDYVSAITSPCKPLLRCVEATLNKHIGKQLHDLGGVELMGEKE